MSRFLPSDSPLDRMLSYHLAVRIQYGSLFYVVMAGFFAFGTESGKLHQAQACFFIVLFVLTGALRMFAARERVRYGESVSVPTRVVARMYCLFLVHAFAWNVFTGYVFYSCFGDMLAETIMVICVAGVTSSCSNLLSSSRALSFFHLAAQIGISGTWAFLARDHSGWLMFVIMVIYLVYQSVIVESQCQHTVHMFTAQIELQENGEELRKARDAAEQASTARSRFLASMSHEIRTPLNGLLGLAQILRDEKTDAAERAEMFETMIRSGDHLRSIVDDILDYSKLTAGRMGLEQVALDLHRLVRETAESLAPMARGKGLAFEVKIADDAPRYLSGDPVRLRQIVLNLLSNAIKFTMEGCVEIGIARRARGTGALIDVRDSGIGISQEEQKRLFQDFTQLDASTKRRFGGTGLGLAITKHLVEQMGGRIWVESSAGNGSRFVVEIPLREAAPPAPGSDPHVAGENAHVSPGTRILVVEDNPVNRRIAEVMLQSTGASITLAEDGGEAVTLQARIHSI